MVPNLVNDDLTTQILKLVDWYLTVFIFFCRKITLVNCRIHRSQPVQPASPDHLESDILRIPVHIRPLLDHRNLRARKHLPCE